MADMVHLCKDKHGKLYYRETYFKYSDRHPDLITSEQYEEIHESDMMPSWLAAAQHFGKWIDNGKDVLVTKRFTQFVDRWEARHE